MSKTVAGVIVCVVTISLVGAGGWYFCMDTLKFSEIVGKDIDPRAKVFVNLFDFDTGLTRYDLHSLKTKSAYWEKRIKDVSAIPDSNLRQQENNKLMAEMMQDPAMSKVAKKVLGFGLEAATSLFGVIVRCN